jgi:ElaB/YqjD/DUF883 family membrane-anchored ribosome-binding protein
MNQNLRTDRKAGQPHQKVGGGSNQGSSTSSIAGGTIEKAQEIGSEAASTLTAQVKALLDDKVSDGADLVGHLASSAHIAAEDLDQNAPQVAGLVRGVADRLESYADDLRDQSVDQLVRAASNYTRRQPAMVFGLAALVGFFALRTIKSAQPTHVGSRREGQLPPAGGFYGS